MADMNQHEDVDETETTEAEFDGMWDEGVPVKVIRGKQRINTQYGTLVITHGQAASATSRRAPGAQLHIVGSSREVNYSS